MSLLEVTSLNSYYGDSHILFDVDLRVEAHEVVALLGRNGAGKSTTLKSLMGLVRPRAGMVLFDGENVAGRPAHAIARRGMVGIYWRVLVLHPPWSWSLCFGIAAVQTSLRGSGGLRRHRPGDMPNISPGSIYSTSPPVVTDRLVIVGGSVNDNVATTSPSGVIRAYDVNTGDLVWNFDSKNPDATAPIANGQTYSENAPNSWSVSSYDPKLGLIYLPMGNQSPDQYGVGRSASVEKYSSSILALDVKTGKPAWVFQTVHHGSTNTAPGDSIIAYALPKSG